VLVFCSVLSLYACFGNIGAVQGQASTSCTDVHGPYVLEANDGGLYGVVGIPFNFQVSNHTIATISGTLIPSSPAEVRILPSFRGDIYATQWIVSGATYNFARTYTFRNGTETLTTTQTSQLISPTTIARTGRTILVPIANGTVTTTRSVVIGMQTTVTISAVTVSGYLDYFRNFCIATRQLTSTAQSTLTSTAESSNLTLLITNNLTLLITVIAVVAVAVVIFVILLKRQSIGAGAEKWPISASPPVAKTGKFCPTCGSPAKSTARFCELCGERLE
jgi:hypothetical protein